MGKSIFFGLTQRFGRDKVYPSLKSGEGNGPRSFFASATTEEPDGEKGRNNYSRFGTDYREKVSSTVKPGDYHVPCKDANFMSKLQENPYF